MRKLLIVVDMQKDFVTGSLANPAVQEIIPAIKNKIISGEYSYLIFTRDTHDENYLKTQEGINLPVAHCIKGTEGHDIIPELEPYSKGALIIDKPSFGFTGWEQTFAEYFDDTFPEDYPTEIELCGTVTSICVMANAIMLKALFPETKITVDTKACADLTPEAQAAAISVFKSQQINVI